MEKRKANVKAVVLLNPGRWGIVLDYVLEENKLIGKNLHISYDEMEDLNETHDGFLMIETLEVPMIKRGDTIEITIRNRPGK
jgi:butyrate kinase